MIAIIVVTYGVNYVAVKPDITCDHSTLKVDEHSQANFYCRVKSNPPADNVYWKWNSTGNEEQVTSGDSLGQIKTYKIDGVSINKKLLLL